MSRTWMAVSALLTAGMLALGVYAGCGYPDPVPRLQGELNPAVILRVQEGDPLWTARMGNGWWPR